MLSLIVILSVMYLTVLILMYLYYILNLYNRHNLQFKEIMLKCILIASSFFLLFFYDSNKNRECILIYVNISENAKTPTIIRIVSNKASISLNFFFYLNSHSINITSINTFFH